MRVSLNLGEYVHAQSLAEVFFHEKGAGGKSKLILKVKFYVEKKFFTLYSCYKMLILYFFA